jgi:hypothetical protein
MSLCDTRPALLPWGQIMKQATALEAKDSRSTSGDALLVSADRAQLRLEVAKQRMRLAKEELKRARKRFKEAKREVKRARKGVAAARKAAKRARKHQPADKSAKVVKIVERAKKKRPGKASRSAGRER